MSIAIIRIVLKDNIPIQVRNEVSSCLLHSRPENDGFNIDLLEDTLVDKGYSNFEIGGNTSYSFLYANIMTNDHKVEFYHSGTDERGYCNIYIETQTQVEIDGETYYYTSKVMNSGDDLEIFSVYFYLAESEIAIDYIQSVDVLVDFKEGDIIFDKIDDEDIINKYYNYDYIKNQVEILNSEIERLNK